MRGGGGGMCCQTPWGAGCGGRYLPPCAHRTGDGVPCTSWGFIVVKGGCPRWNGGRLNMVVWAEKWDRADESAMRPHQDESEVTVLAPLQEGSWSIHRFWWEDDVCLKYWHNPVSTDAWGGTGMRSRQWWHWPIGFLSLSLKDNCLGDYPSDKRALVFVN